MTGDRTISQTSTVTLGLLVVIIGGIFAVWQRADVAAEKVIEAAKVEAAWRALADEHAKHAQVGIERLAVQYDGIDERLDNIEARVSAYESWPRASK